MRLSQTIQKEGTGKGIFMNALSHMKKLVTIDGKAFAFEKSFAIPISFSARHTDTALMMSRNTLTLKDSSVW